MNGSTYAIGVSVMMTLCGLLLGASSLGCSAARQAPPASPALAFSAAATDVDAGCSFVGAPRILATQVRPMAGISAVAEGSVVWLRFATTRDARVAVAVDPDTLQVAQAGEPPPEAVADTRGPAQVELNAHARLLAWTQWSTEESSVKAVVVTDRGTSFAPPLDLSLHGSAIGRPALALGASGEGVLAFIESNEVGFEVVVVHARCAIGGVARRG